jgi:hypothetical protein
MESIVGAHPEAVAAVVKQCIYSIGAEAKSLPGFVVVVLYLERCVALVFPDPEYPSSRTQPQVARGILQKNLVVLSTLKTDQRVPAQIADRVKSILARVVKK